MLINVWTIISGNSFCSFSAGVLGFWILIILLLATLFLETTVFLNILHVLTIVLHICDKILNEKQLQIMI